MNIVKEPMTIRTSGLGSCVGIVLYDEAKKIAGYGTYHASRFQPWESRIALMLPSLLIREFMP